MPATMNRDENPHGFNNWREKMISTHLQRQMELKTTTFRPLLPAAKQQMYFSKSCSKMIANDIPCISQDRIHHWTESMSANDT